MNSAKNTEYLFVYGTLRKEVDHPMSELVEKYTIERSSGTIQGKLFDAGTFPAAVTSGNESDTVHGDLYKLEDPKIVFQHLDPYEGYSPQQPTKSLFLRKIAPVQLPDKNSVDAWIYLYNRSVKRLTLIPNGNYLSYCENNY